MGVNIAGFTIVNHEVSDKASKDEIIRRFLNKKVVLRNSRASEESLDKIFMLMRGLNLSLNDRPVYKTAHNKEDLSGKPSTALSLKMVKLLMLKLHHHLQLLPHYY